MKDSYQELMDAIKEGLPLEIVSAHYARYMVDRNGNNRPLAAAKLGVTTKTLARWGIGGTPGRVKAKEHENG